MFKITTLSKKIAPKAFIIDDNEVVESSNSSKTKKMVRNLSRNLTLISNIGTTKKSKFLIFNAKKTFNYLWLIFIKALIFQHFDSKSHIQIKIDVSDYVIGGVLS